MPSSSTHHHSASSSNVDRAVDSMARLSVSSGPPRRPRTIAELAEAAKVGTDDDNLPLKQHLRNAESARKQGRRLYDEDDLENAFIQLARAATIVLEKLPAHKDYRTLLNSTQRHNMGLVSAHDPLNVYCAGSVIFTFETPPIRPKASLQHFVHDRDVIMFGTGIHEKASHSAGCI